MKQMTSNDLTEFYKGDLSPKKRLLIEEFLLDSQPGLMEYFAIKRDNEETITFLAKPTSAVKEKLMMQIEQNRPSFVNRKRLLATAALILIALGTYMASEQNTEEMIADSTPALSIDATGELLAGGGFL